MKLFKKVIDPPQTRLLSNLEKIAKICALRISKDYTDSAVEDLNWIQENFIALLRLRETDEPYFLSLIDPNGRYKKVKVLEAESPDIDWSNFSMTFIDELPQEQEIDPLVKKYVTIYAPFEPDKINELLLRYIQTILTIWNAALAKENRLVAKYCLYTFINWMSIIDKINDDNVDYPAILKTFLLNLELRNFSVLNNDSDKLPDAVALFSYNNYLNRIFNEDIFTGNIELYFEYLFRYLYQVVEANKFVLAEQFISRCIDSTYYPSYRNNYSELYSLVHRKMSDANIDNALEILKPIPQLGLYRLNYIETLFEYNDWLKEFDHFIETKVQNRIALNEDIHKQIISLKEHAFKIYKFNRLQVTTLKLLSFCLFKDNYSTLKHALHYNQPPDSNAIHGNKDIVPVTLNEILNAVSVKYEMEHELLGFWGGHHGVEPYLDRLLVILFYHYRRKRNYGDENLNQVVSNYCQNKLKNDPGRIEGFKQHIERLKEIFELLLKGSKINDEFFKSQEKVNDTKSVFDTIINTCDQAMVNIEETAPISKESKDGFLNSIIEIYQKYNFLNQFFKKFGKPVDIQTRDKDSFGFNEMMDRTAFISSWHIPYIGYIENYGRDLADQENRNGQFLLSNNVNLQKIKESEITKILSKYDGDDYVVILWNIRLDMLLYKDENYTPAHRLSVEEKLIEGFLQGKYKNLLVFGLYDQLFHKSMLMVKKSDLQYSEHNGEIKQPFVATNNFKTSFIDFGTDIQNLQNMIDKAPLWLQEQFKDNEEAMRSYLKKKVWVRMYKRTRFEKGKDAKCVEYQIE